MLCPGVVVGSKKPRLFLKAELTDFSQTLYLPYSTVSWWLCFTSLTPLSLLNWGAPKLTEYCRYGLPAGWMAGNDLLALLVLILTSELLQPLLPGHPAQSVSLSTRPLSCKAVPASPSHPPSLAFAFELHQGPAGPFLQPVLQHTSLCPQSDSACQVYTDWSINWNDFLTLMKAVTEAFLPH